MHQNRTGLYTTNSLSSHASLLLSQTPTIISSPLQNNTNNPQHPVAPSTLSLARKQPSTPLLAASNLDNDTHSNNDSPSNINPQEGYINFKKPQNEMFKKLDGKIQKIVAAHSNLNKLYALNDFPSLGVGPKRPFELPAQLPPPPPWVPKVSTDFNNHFDESHIETLKSLKIPPSVSLIGVPQLSHNVHNDLLTTATSPQPSAQPKSTISLDSAISKLHQRRQMQQQLLQAPNHSGSPSVKLEQPRGTKDSNSIARTNATGDKVFYHPQRRLVAVMKNSPQVAGPSNTNRTTSSSKLPTTTMTPAQFSILAKKIKDTLDTEQAFKDQKGNLTPEDRKKFQDDLISMLKREISAVTKSANLKFSPPPESRSRQLERKSLLLKSSPQTLFNTIRKETSILLSKQQSHSGARSSLSLLNDQQTFNRQNVQVSPQFFNRNRPQTIRVIVPPSQNHNGLKFDNYLEKERPQPSTDMVTIEQFAKCLDLVRSNDASIQRHQEQLLRAETKWRMHLSNRPLRLRRLRGEKIRMPASASYKATRKAGLQ